MSKLYFELIQKGLRTISDVPEKWRSEVEKLLEEQDEKENRIQ